MTMREMNRRLEAIESRQSSGMTVWRQVSPHAAEGPDGRLVRLQNKADGTTDLHPDDLPVGPGLHVLVARFSFAEAV